jgi:porin
VDGVPGDPGDTHRSRWHLSRSEGALLIGEVSAAAGPIAQLSLGHWRYTATFEGLHLEDSDGRGQLARDNHGTYITAELAPQATQHEAGPRWSGFLRAGTANDRINAFEQHVAAGVVVAGPWPGRRGSELGLAASEARVGDGYRAARRRDSAPAERCERNVELTWRVPVSEHAVLQPDLQYVVNPGADRSLPDAWIVGLRLELSLAR